MGFPTKKKEEQTVIIEPAKIVRTTITIKGTAPLVQNKFSKKARDKMAENMTKLAVDQKSKRTREPRNFDEELKQAQHRSIEAFNGIPCSAFRAAMIDACRLAGLVMTRAKMSLFVMPDSFDSLDGTPLVKLVSKGGPEKHEGLVRLADGSADIRVCPMWREWSANVTVEFDADMITASSVINLLDRAGRQIGVGEGRPFSKNSVGLGWGTFQVVDTQPKKTTPKTKTK